MAHRYWKPVAAAAAIILLVTVGFQVWQTWQQNQRLESSERFTNALTLLNEGDDLGAVAELGALSSEGGGYGVLASFNEARLLAADDDVAAAVAIWDRLAADSATSPAFRGVATLLSVMHQINDGDAAALEAKLQPLTEAGNAYRPLAMELSAAIALRQGDQARATSLYTLIADDPTAPVGVRGRAARMLAALEE
ncbi:MAG: tetratricopeptide repeat protein [Pseudomonadota bacterium]